MASEVMSDFNPCPESASEVCEYWIFSDIITEIKAEKDRIALLEKTKTIAKQREDEQQKRNEEIEAELLQYAPAGKKKTQMLKP